MPRFPAGNEPLDVIATLHTWVLAARPKTLVISLAPLLMGGALAYAETGLFHWLPWVAALLAAMLIQIGANLHNDAEDFERGADTPDRLGPKRAAAEGWLSVATVRRAAFGCFGAAFVFGIYLAWVGGMPIVWLGLASLACGYAYTGGPRPIAYTPLGELFVLAFFGLAAVGGTYYLQTLTLSHTALIAGIAAGLPAAAVLVVNNYRDIETDLRVGKRTLATFIGRPASRLLFTGLLLLPLLLALLVIPDPLLRWLPWLAVIPALWLIRQIVRLPVGPELNRLLAHTAQYCLGFSLLCAAALLG